LAKERPKPTYEGEVLHILAYEFPFNEKAEAEEKIHRVLKRKKLGAYNQEHINLLRRFKDDVQAEIGLGLKSKYYTHRHNHYADPRDFADEKYTADLAKKYPVLSYDVLANFVSYAVYLYYLR
jgi:hypothetical protein